MRLNCPFLPPEKLTLLSLLVEANPSPDRKMIKVLTFDNLLERFRMTLKNGFVKCSLFVLSVKG